MSSSGYGRILKVLSANDVGLTRSHQAGLTVPKSIVGFFPKLEPDRFNPDAWIEVRGPGGQSWPWRYIYYNSRLHGLGTRNEYRLTHVRKAIREMGATYGDILEFTRNDDDSLAVKLAYPHGSDVDASADVIELEGPGHWFAAQLPRR